MARRTLKEKIYAHRSVSGLFGLSFLLIAGGVLWAYIALRDSEQPLIIHFNNLVRINHIGSMSDLLNFGGFGLILLLVNFFLALDLEERDWFLGKLVAAATLGLAILIFITFTAIISVN